MSRFSQAFLCAVALVVLGCAAAQTTKAAPLVFTTRNAFDIAVPSYNTITFDGHSVPYANSLATSGVTFAGGSANYQVGVIEGTNVGVPGNFVLTSNTNAPGQFNVDNILITPPTGTRAFGFDIKSSNAALTGATSAGSYEIYVNGALAATVVVPSFNSFSFIGFTSDVDITSLAIRALSGGDPVIDNVSFSGAAAQETPEPATLVLLGTGLAGAASAARRRRRAGANQAQL
ncbi:MAG TPA: PEP-CTERM sorting domain-containing protein [Pyrinomonadaceae bacterium]|jgi:hypothetical protein